MQYSKGLCININDTCSLNCEWCYKKNTTIGTLSYQRYQKFYNSVIKNNIGYVSMIGGEPTEHKDFLKILRITKEKNILLNTNGLEFDDLGVLKECLEATEFNIRRNLRITISIKGYSQNSFYYTTGEKKGFNRLCNAINNIKKQGVPCVYTYVYSGDLSTFENEKFNNFLFDRKIDSIIISDLRDHGENECTQGLVSYVTGYENTIKYLEQKGVEVYARISKPLCIYNKDFIQYLINKRKLISTCAIKHMTGFFVSSNLELIACNQLGKCVFGEFGKHFNNYAELCELWNSKEVRDFYEILSGYPQEKCIECGLWKICGGGCILNWRCNK